MIKIAVDAMGGDYAPEQQVKGALLALERNKDIAVILCGDEKALKAELAKTPHDGSRVEVVHTTEIITNEEAPTKAVKTKKDSSTVVAFRLLKEGKADGLVSSGSTGAVLSAGVLILGRLKGVSRPALCPLLPNLEGKYTFLCDCGANLECKPVNLLHFALLASSYAQAVYGVENPRCGLLNNGTEDHKGDLVHQEANALLKTAKGINYIGNIEGREIMLGGVDVVIADGYTGNIALKSVEGTAKAVSSIVKKQFMKNAFTKIRALFVKDILNGVKKSMDYEAGGGAMFLGLSKTVVKAHGNSKATSFSVAIEQAAGAVRSDMLGKTKEMLDKLNAELAEQTAEKTE